MRKFSKKIAMMMVLAMLVSMFSGIVSASAASIWSAKSVDDDNYAVVMGEAIEVKKGEFINFDLYKADEEATEAGYEYTWESSDEEVIFIGNLTGKNGYARVKGEVGDEATISATFTNLETGKSATRSFDVVVVEELAEEVEEVEYIITPNFGDEAFIVGTEYELKAEVTDAEGEAVEAKVVFSIDDKEVAKYTPAEAGEVTIVATVTIGEEEFEAEFVCDVYQAVIESVVQKDAKTIEITLDEKISDAEALKNINLFLGTVSKNNYKKKATVKDNVVTLESYATFGNGKTWTVVYGDSKAEFEASQGEVAKVVITGPEFFYLKTNGKVNDPAAITYVCYDKNDVKVEKPSEAYIEWKLEGDGTLASDAVSFSEADKSATITGIYHTGKFDEKNNYQEITYDIEPYTVISVDNNDATMIAISDKGVSNSGSAKYDSLVVPVNKTGYKLYVKFLFDDAKATKKTPGQLGTDGFDEKGNQIVTYESTDTTKLIVDPKNAELLPLKEGKVDVVVNVNGEFFGAVTVEIGTAEVATAPSVAASATQLSNSTLLNQSVTYKATGKTNYSSDISYAINKVEVVSDPYNPKTEEAVKTALKNGAFFSGIGTAEVKVSVTDGTNYLKAGNYVFKLTIKSADNKEFTQNVSVYVRAAKAGDEIKSIGVEFVNSNGTYDTAANKDTTNFNKIVDIRFVGKNKDGVAVKYMDPTAVTSSIEVKLGSEKQNKLVVDSLGAFLRLYNIDDNGIYSVSGSAVTGYTAIKDGNYVVTGKIDGMTIPNTVFTVKNSQAKPALSLTDAGAALTVVAGSDLKTGLANCYKALDAASDGAYNYSAIQVVDVKATDSAEKTQVGEYVVVITKVVVYQNFKNGAIVKHTLEPNQAITLTVTAE